MRTFKNHTKHLKDPKYNELQNRTEIARTAMELMRIFSYHCGCDKRKLFSGRWLAATESAAEFEALRCARTSVASLVSAASVLIPLASGARWAAGSARFVRRSSFPGAGLRTRGAFQRRRHDLGGKVEEVAQVLNTLICQVPVVVSPGELFRDHSLGLERLARFDDVEVGNALQFLMFRREVILLGDHHTFLEEVLEDGDSVLFGHQHFR